MSRMIYSRLMPVAPWSRTRGPVSGLALVVALSAGPAWSQEAGPPSAAELDWRPRAELPEAVRQHLPVYCEGGYLPSVVQPEQAATDAGSGAQPLQASGLDARYEIDRSLVLDGDVRIRQGSFEISGQRARFDQEQGRVTVEGPLISRGQGIVLTGDAAAYDVSSGQLDLNTATFLLHGPGLRGSAERLSRQGDAEVLVRSGELTTCGPHSNDWAVVASEIRLDREEGIGTAKHVRLEVLDTPVFYWPWLSFPIDDRRKSGFLYPQFGSSSAGGGMFLALPYYFNLAPHYDATLTPQYIHGRGLFTEAEVRYLSRFGQTDLQLGYIADDQAYTDDNPGEDGERWALKLTTRADFGAGWAGYGDYAVVSDNDYLGDLNRTLDISQATHLSRKGGFRYRGENQLLDVYLSDYQTISDSIDDDEVPYARLPDIRYDAQLGDSLWELDLSGRYTYFYRDNEDLSGLDAANGGRLRLVPELALPLRALWGYSRPSLTLDYTRYELEDYSLGDGSFDRTVPVFEWDNGLYFDRNVRISGSEYHQTLEPRLYYAWADADTDQNDIPDFDTAVRSFRFDQLFQPDRFVGGDRVGDANRMTVALTSRLHDLVTGAERARVSLGQVYYFDDSEVTLFGEGGETGSRSPLAGEIVLNPLDTLEIRASGLWDPDTGETEEGRSLLMYHWQDYRYLASLGHTYRKDDLEQTDIAGVLPLSNRLSLIGRWVYAADLERTAGSLVGIEYNNCCWSVQLVHQNYLTDEETLDSRVLFRIQLKGLGGTGGASASLAEAIEGFDERERRLSGTP